MLLIIILHVTDAMEISSRIKKIALDSHSGYTHCRLMVRENVHCLCLNASVCTYGHDEVTRAGILHKNIWTKINAVTIKYTMLVKAVRMFQNYLDYSRVFDEVSFSFLFLARQPPVGQGLLIHEVSRTHTSIIMTSCWHQRSCSVRRLLQGL